MNLRYLKEIIKTSPRIFAVIGILLVLNTSFYLYAALYQQKRIEALQDTWFSKRNAAAGGAGQDTATIYQQGETDLKAWQSRILPKKKFTAFLGSISDLAANNSLAFNGITYKFTPYKPENLIAYTLDFSVVGKYAAAKSFIADINRMDEIVTIDAVGVSSNASNDAVNLTLQMTVYLKPEEQ